MIKDDTIVEWWDLQPGDLITCERTMTLSWPPDGTRRIHNDKISIPKIEFEKTKPFDSFLIVHTNPIIGELPFETIFNIIDIIVLRGTKLWWLRRSRKITDFYLHDKT